MIYQPSESVIIYMYPKPKYIDICIPQAVKYQYISQSYVGGVTRTYINKAL